MAGSFFDPGLFTARLTLEESIESSDGQGGSIRLWHPVGEIWARIEPAGVETEETGASVAQAITHRILIRHRDGMSPARRLRKGARVFSIVTVHDPDETERFLAIAAIEEIPL